MAKSKKSILSEITHALQDTALALKSPVMGKQDPKQLAGDVRQAITTSYQGPTGSSGSRIVAKCEAKRITVPYDHALSSTQNHAAAALQLMDVLGWSARDRLVMGGTGRDYVFVQVPKI